MGMIYCPDRFEDEIRLTIKMLTTYDAMNIHSKEERKSKEKRTKKEIKKKVEKLSLSTREALSLAEKKNSGNDYFEQVIPTAEEVQAYLDSLGETRFSGEIFCDYYAVDGWMTKNNRPIKNWKAKVRDWRKMEKTPANKKKSNATLSNAACSHQQPCGPTEAEVQAAEAQRDELLENRLKEVFDGNQRITWLSRILNKMAKKLGVSAFQYNAEMMTEDARHLSDLWYRNWTYDVFCDAFKWVAKHFDTISKPTISSKVRELFYMYGVEKNLTPAIRTLPLPAKLT